MTEIAPIANSVQEMTDLVAHHAGTITGKLQPEMADFLLGLGAGNRQLIESGAARFQKIADTGAWVNTGEPIVVSTDGKLIDGQHRLTGIVRSGRTVVVDVRFGAHPKAFQAMGTGARRTAAHALHILGESFGPTQAGLARLVYLHDNKLFSQIHGGVEIAIIVRVVQENPNIKIIGKAIQGSKFRPARSTGFGFPLVLAARVSPMDMITNFIDLASSGLSDSPKRPARMLHQRLLDALSRKERLDQMEVAAITARCWNAFAEGRDVKQLKVLPTDKSGQFFPKVIGPPEKPE